MAIEYRYMRKAAPAVTDDGKLRGRAWPYNSATHIGSGPYGFRETIRRGAGKKSINDGDIVLLDNHESRLPLARMSAGTLTMREGAQGGDWEAQVVDTTYGMDVRKNVKAGNYGGCSFGFEVIKDVWTDDEGNPATPMDGTQREIVEMKVHEVSVCTFPAYGDGATSVSTKEMIRAARGMTAEQERFASAEVGDIMAMSPHGADTAGQEGAAGEEECDPNEEDCTKANAEAGGGRSARAAAATYSDLTTCGECGSKGQYSSFCTNCGENMRASESSDEYCGSCGQKMPSGARSCANCGTEVRGGNAPGDGSKPYGNVSYADPGYQSDKKKRYPIDTKDHAKAAWSYVNKAKNAAKYTASQLASIKSKIKAALKKFGVQTAEANMAEWEALVSFREMTEGWETAEKPDFGVLPGDVARAEDVNWLARDIKDANTTEARMECIERATDFGLSDMLPEHWSGTGGLGTAVNDEVRRDMDAIYALALKLPATRISLDILDLAQAYLPQEDQDKAAREREELEDEPEMIPLTRAEAQQRMDEAKARMRALSGRS